MCCWVYSTQPDPPYLCCLHVHFAPCNSTGMLSFVKAVPEAAVLQHNQALYERSKGLHSVSISVLRGQDGGIRRGFLPLSCVITEIQRRLLLMSFVQIMNRGKKRKRQIDHLYSLLCSYFPNSVSFRRNGALWKQAANESRMDRKCRK